MLPGILWELVAGDKVLVQPGTKRLSVGLHLLDAVRALSQKPSHMLSLDSNHVVISYFRTHALHAEKDLLDECLVLRGCKASSLRIPKASKARGCLDSKALPSLGPAFQTVKQMAKPVRELFFHIFLTSATAASAGLTTAALRPPLRFARSSKVLLAHVMGSPCVARYQLSVSPQQT